MSNGSTLQLNRELARQINEEALKNPVSPYAGKFVGIANGQMAVVGEDFNDAIDQLRRIESDPQKCFFIEANADYSVVEEIWGVP